MSLDDHWEMNDQELRDRYRMLLVALIDSLANGAFTAAIVGLAGYGGQLPEQMLIRAAILAGGWRFVLVLDKESSILSIPEWMRDMTPSRVRRRDRILQFIPGR